MAKAEGEAMDWKHLLAYITGTVDQELLVRNEHRSPKTASYGTNSRGASG